MNSKLIIESGSTKANWVLLIDSEIKKKIKTNGLNPVVQESDVLLRTLSEAYNKLGFRDTLDSIVFYTAGIDTEIARDKARRNISEIFDTDKLEVYSDMLAACRAMAGDSSCYVNILGTGSNSTFYDQGQMHSQLPSLGYVLADEGSGNRIGRAMLKLYFYEIMSPELRENFWYTYGVTKEILLENIYAQPSPNKYLATFAPFAMDHKNDPIVRQHLMKELEEFVTTYLLSQENIHTYESHFVGGVAANCKDELAELMNKHGLKLGKITGDPLEDLIRYHQ